MLRRLNQPNRMTAIDDRRRERIVRLPKKWSLRERQYRDSVRVERTERRVWLGECIRRGDALPSNAAACRAALDDLSRDARLHADAVRYCNLIAKHGPPYDDDYEEPPGSIISPEMEAAMEVAAVDRAEDARHSADDWQVGR